MQTTLIITALVIGGFLPIQMGLNAQLLNNWSQNAVLATLASFIVGTIALVGYMMITRVPVPALSTSTAPWYAWTGGLLGALGVSVLTYLAPRLGALTMISLIICSQLILSIVFDHFGIIGYPLRPITIMRCLGVVLLIVGAFLVTKY